MDFQISADFRGFPQHFEFLDIFGCLGNLTEISSTWSLFADFFWGIWSELWEITDHFRRSINLAGFPECFQEDMRKNQPYHEEVEQKVEEIPPQEQSKVE